MTVKELIEALKELPQDLEVLREYDDSFEPVYVQHTQLAFDGTRYGDTLYSGETLREAVVIHSGNPVLLREYVPNKGFVESTVAALEMERILPKIKESFERDDFFFKKLK